MLEGIVGQSIRTIRQQNGMTLEDLSYLTGLTETHIGRIERGNHNPTLATVDRIAVALGMKLSDLIRMDLTDDTLIDRFVKNTFPYSEKLELYDPLLLLDFLGQILLDKLTLKDVENCAYAGFIDAKFKALKEYHDHEDIGKYISYGLQADYGDGDIIIISDVTTKQEYIQQIIKTFRNFRISKTHLFEAVEDFVYDPD